MFRAGDRAVFIHGFAKTRKENLSRTELYGVKELAKELLSYDGAGLKEAVKSGALKKVNVMTSKLKSYRSEVLASVHEAASDLHDAGLMGKQTLRKFDDMCLTPVEPLPPKQIRAIREQERVSQAVFARHLNVTTGLVSQWERGEKKPAGASLKLLTLVRTKGLSAIA